MKCVVGFVFNGVSRHLVEVDLTEGIHFISEGGVPKRRTGGYIDLTNAGVGVVDCTVVSFLEGSHGGKVVIHYVAPITERDRVWESLLPSRGECRGASFFEILEMIPDGRPDSSPTKPNQKN